MKNSYLGPTLIMIAASLWAVDALFRTQLTFTIPTGAIIFLEYIIGATIMLPIFKKNIAEYKKLTQKDWWIFMSMVTVSSVLGIILFTEALNRSFAQYDFATPLLIQKLQPVFVIFLSAFILKEKLTPRFLALAAIAFVGSYLITFGFNSIPLSLEGKGLVFLLALGAAASWGSGTIMSKYVLTKLNFPAATALRLVASIPVAAVFMIVMGETYNFMNLGWGDMWRFLMIAGVTGGALAIYLYYKGLQTTQAKVSTIAELMFPIISILIAVTPLNPYGEPQILSGGNILGIFLLLGSIIMITFTDHNTEKSK